MNFPLPEGIKYVLNTLNDAGFDAYIVGGCVRDILLGSVPHDYDITTSATPARVEELFPNVIKTGIKHGTVTVMHNGEPIEVTTFRTEGGYSDSRRPDSVDFVTDVSLDLARRDFTVNAMCYCEKSGLVDCFGGKEDIDRKILRAVGNPEERFCEDALRILRLFRFACTLNFEIEPATLAAAIKCSHLLSRVSAERIAAELRRATMGENISVLSLLLESGALEYYGLHGCSLKDVPSLSSNQDIRLFALLNLSSENAAQSAKMLKLSNNFCAFCEDMQALLSAKTSEDTVSFLKACLANYGTDTVLLAFHYKEKICGIDCDFERKETQRIIGQNEPYALCHLAVSGIDIAETGIKGERIGQVLNLLLDRVRKEPRLNTKDVLLKIAREI